MMASALFLCALVETRFNIHRGIHDYRQDSKTYGWPEGKIIGLAKAAAEDLAKTGLEQGAILVWLDGVREEPGKYLADPMFATLARECLRRAKAPHDRHLILFATSQWPSRSGAKT